MILPRYMTAVAAVDSDRVTSFLVRRALGLGRRPMMYALIERGLGQADLVLALIRLGTRAGERCAERVMGRPIVRCPCQYLRWPINGVPRVVTPRIYLVVDNNPRRPGTEAAHRFESAFRDGSTVEQCRARGATRRDVRRALRKGWVRLVRTDGRAA